jgi:hypothetical protein
VSAGLNDLSPNALLNTAGEMALRLDETLIRMGVSLPAGGSLVAVARKPPGKRNR